MFAGITALSIADLLLLTWHEPVDLDTLALVKRLIAAHYPDAKIDVCFQCGTRNVAIKIFSAEQGVHFERVWPIEPIRSLDLAPLA